MSAGFAFGINWFTNNAHFYPKPKHYAKHYCLPSHKFVPSHRNVLHVHPHILMTLTLHMPLVAAGRQGYRNSLCFQGCPRRGTDSHVLRAAWHQLLDGCEIGWTEKPVWNWPERLTSVMVLCSDMTIVWVGTVFDMDPESLRTDAGIATKIHLRS